MEGRGIRGAILTNYTYILHKFDISDVIRFIFRNFSKFDYYLTSDDMQ